MLAKGKYVAYISNRMHCHCDNFHPATIDTIITISLIKLTYKALFKIIIMFFPLSLSYTHKKVASGRMQGKEELYMQGYSQDTLPTSLYLLNNTPTQ